MTARMNLALAALRRARDEGGDPHGLVSSSATFLDPQQWCANVHWRTAGALWKAGLIRYGVTDLEWGTEIYLTETAS